MKRLLRLLAVLIFAPIAANAATLITNIFSIEVPSQWQVQDNKTSTFLVTGNNVIDGVSSPFLSIQYCVSRFPPKVSGQRQCTVPCSEQLNDLTSNSKLKDAKFSPIVKIEKENGVTEYSTELVSPTTISALIALSCSSQGQIHIALESDLQKEVTKRQFEEILNSLKWN